MNAALNPQHGVFTPLFGVKRQDFISFLSNRSNTNLARDQKKPTVSCEHRWWHISCVCVSVCARESSLEPGPLRQIWLVRLLAPLLFDWLKWLSVTGLPGNQDHLLLCLFCRIDDLQFRDFFFIWNSNKPVFLYKNTWGTNANLSLYNETHTQKCTIFVVEF